MSGSGLSPCASKIITYTYSTWACFVRLQVIASPVCVLSRARHRAGKLTIKRRLAMLLKPPCCNCVLVH